MPTFHHSPLCSKAPRQIQHQLLSCGTIATEFFPQWLRGRGGGCQRGDKNMCRISVDKMLEPQLILVVMICQAEDQAYIYLSLSKRFLASVSRFISKPAWPHPMLVGYRKPWQNLWFRKLNLLSILWYFMGWLSLSIVYGVRSTAVSLHLIFITTSKRNN
jgi:hypothetical protein